MTFILRSLKKRNLFRLHKEDFTQKIGLISLCVSMVVILLIIASLVIYIDQKRVKKMNADGLALTSMAAGYYEKGLEKDGAEKLLKIINYSGSESGMVYGIIVDIHNRVMAHTDIFRKDIILDDKISENVALSNKPLKQVYEDPDTSRTIYEYSRPVFNNGKKIGSVRLGFSKDITPLFTDSDIRGLLFIAALVFSLVPVFYYSVRGSMSPLLTLNEDLKSLLVKHDLGEIQDNPKGGMDELVDRFNKVIARINRENEALNIAREDMELANKVISYEKERIESVFECIDSGIMVTDSMGEIILVNQAMANIMDMSRQEVLGKTIGECFDNEEIISFIKRNQLDFKAVAAKSLKITLNKSEREIILLVAYMPLLDQEETVQGNVMIVKDITAEKIARQTQSDFIAHVSHELRTPLTTITSYVEMLMDDEVHGRETKIDFFNTISDEASRLGRLISNLLNISKIEMGNLTINKDFVKSREFFEDVVRSIENQAVKKNIKLNSILPEKISALVMDKDLISVAILNILSNAMKYTPAGGSVTINVEEDDNYIIIDIVDTGYGIAEEELPNIFDKFFRSSDEKIRANSGNGLGLALTRDILRLHDGKIDVSSNIGLGTSFTLKLPREVSPRISNYRKSYSSLMND